MSSFPGPAPRSRAARRRSEVDVLDRPAPLTFWTSIRELPATSTPRSLQTTRDSKWHPKLHYPTCTAQTALPHTHTTITPSSAQSMAPSKSKEEMNCLKKRLWKSMCGLQLALEVLLSFSCSHLPTNHTIANVNTHSTQRAPSRNPSSQHTPQHHPHTKHTTHTRTNHITSPESA